jgi:RNA-binding protein
LLQVGTSSHLARSGRLIIRLSREVKPGAFLLDDAGRRLGRIVELIGPVRAPYASVAIAGARSVKKGDPAFVEG